MANRNWNSSSNRSGGGGYGSFNNPMGGGGSMYQNQSFDRRSYGPPRGGAGNPPSSYRGDFYSKDRSRYDDRKDFRRDLPPRRDEKRSYMEDSYSSSSRKSGFGNRKHIGRYEVKPPKYTLDLKESSVSILRTRYPRMYVPSDFFHSDHRWQEVFPMHQPYKLGFKADFHVFNKEVEMIEPLDETATIDPPDVNYTFSAKVLLMQQPDLAELYKLTCNAAEEGVDSDAVKTSLTKAISFVVGTKGKNELMAIGGPWSPSLDGNNPDEDPKVLINTAIRTCKALTGVDLSTCQNWYNFLELHYYRPADRHVPTTDEAADKPAGLNEEMPEAKVETVVIFIPDVWNCMPLDEAWAQTKIDYNQALDKLLHPLPKEPEVHIEEPGTEADVATEESVDKPAESAAEEKLDDGEAKETKEVKKEEPAPKELDEKDRKRLEKLYKLPDKTSILVHPSATAKGGRFDCHKMSLNSLLEYRLEDQKEHTFEVSLFAEQFYEMILRDAAFNIYKAIVVAPEKKAADDDKSEPDSKRRRTDDIDIDGGERVRKNQRTVNLPLLLSFSIFDWDHADYIKEHDLEDIIQSLGLKLSRSQVRKLLGKIINKRNTISYRDLTDKEVVEGEDGDITVISEELDDIDYVIELSQGNKGLFDDEGPKLPSRVVLGGGSDEELLNKLETALSKKQAVELQFTRICDELEKIRKLHNAAKDTEADLRSNVENLEAKFEKEHKQVRDLQGLTEIYRSIMRQASDAMTRSNDRITRQFEKEHEEKEAIKKAAEEKIAKEKAEAEAALKAAEEKDQEKPVENGNMETEEGAAAPADDNKDAEEVFEVLDSA